MDPDESVYAKIGRSVNLEVIAFVYNFIVLDNNSAPQSSSRGMQRGLTGATLDFAVTRLNVTKQCAF